VFAWRDHAHRFIRAANRLVSWYEPIITGEAQGPWEGGFQPIMLLYGVAVENLLKALVIAHGVLPVDTDGNLSRELKHHRLNDLTHKAGLAVSDVEVVLLTRLRDFIESGKYPIEKDADSGHGATVFYYREDVRDTLALL
jgi:hypothetical protein